MSSYNCTTSILLEFGESDHFHDQKAVCCQMKKKIYTVSLAENYNCIFTYSSKTDLHSWHIKTGTIKAFIAILNSKEEGALPMGEMQSERPGRPQSTH